MTSCSSVGRPDWLQKASKTPSDNHRQQALARQQQLTKPPGSLGKLEALAVTLASLQYSNTPKADVVAISIFAADHGVAAENVSAFPQAVTGEMVRNFASGGAAIAVLARQLNASLRVCNVGTVSKLETIDGVEDCRIAAGTANFCQQPAMSELQLEQALAVGKQQLNDAHAVGKQLWLGGEMGIANTTSATALACALLQRPASALTGPGTGIDQDTQLHKQERIDYALQLHQLNDEHAADALTALRCVGGFEIAALTGAYVRGAQLGLPMLVDGFIASTAALAAIAINPDCRDWLLLSHHSAEPGHTAIIEQFSHVPLLNLDMRLGEGSGAACAVNLLRTACALHNEMATFDSANISTE